MGCEDLCMSKCQYMGTRYMRMSHNNWIKGREINTYIEGVIKFEDELELRGKVANRTGHEAEQDGSGCGGRQAKPISLNCHAVVYDTHGDQRNQNLV